VAHRSTLVTLALMIATGTALTVAGAARLPSQAAPGAVAAPFVAPVPSGWIRSIEPITVNGMARSYLVIRPAAAGTTRLPVLMELAGNGATPDVEATRGGFLGVTGPAILVYPTGYGLTWDAGNCCGPAMWDHIDDVGFLTAVVHRVLGTESDANPAQVYLSGYSNGGKMVFLMACAAPKLFTAFAVYGAVNATPCQHPAPVSLLEVVATADPELTIPPAGHSPAVNGYAGPTVVDQVDQYRRAAGCTAATSTVGQGDLTSTTWTRCRSGKTVQLSIYLGGNHDWPQGNGVTPSAEQVMWTYFRTGRATGPGITAPPKGSAPE
jgi:polyhydroxybutyrate depolymerase